MVIKQYLLVGSLISILTFSCKHTGIDSQPPGPAWRPLGLTGKWVEKAVLAEPFLYACVRADGLWRLNLQSSDTNWVYLGLADSSLGRNDTYGVRDVVISENNPDWLLAIARPRDRSGHGMFRSLDEGKTWLPTDSGLMYTDHNSYFHPERLLQLGGATLAAGQGINVFRSSDFGESWVAAIGGVVPGMIEIRALISHQKFSDVIWLGGWNSVSRAFLAKSTDGLNTLLPVEALQNVDLGGVNALALDPADTTTLYAGLFSELAKTTDAGKTWETVFAQETNAILLDPHNSSHLWVSTQEGVWDTNDAGLNWSRVAEIPMPIRVGHMVWDENRQVIYMSASTGIFQYRP